MSHKLATVFIVGCLAPAANYGSDFSFTGSFSDPNEVFLQPFTLQTISDVTVQTWSYGGGTNEIGDFIPPGGFDPFVSLFDPNQALLNQNDDGACPPGEYYQGNCFDATLFEPELQPGQYTLALTVSPNNPAGLTLSDGFTGGGDFYGLNTDFAVDVDISPDQTVSPEPHSAGSLFLGLTTLTVSAMWRAVRSLTSPAKRPEN